MKHTVLILAPLMVLFSCNEPQARRPIQQKTGSFFKESVARSKQLLAEEEKTIKEIIKLDSIHGFKTSSSGFWYYLEQQVDTTVPVLRPDDEVLLTYGVMNLSGDTIYAAEEIGQRMVKIDKSKLFPGLRNGIKLMREGEKATFYFPSSQAYGYKGDNNRIVPNTPLRVSVTILQQLPENDTLQQIK